MGDVGRVIVCARGTALKLPSTVSRSFCEGSDSLSRHAPLPRGRSAMVRKGEPRTVLSSLLKRGVSGALAFSSTAISTSMTSLGFQLSRDNIKRWAAGEVELDSGGGKGTLSTNHRRPPRTGCTGASHVASTWSRHAAFPRTYFANASSPQQSTSRTGGKKRKEKSHLVSCKVTLMMDTLLTCLDSLLLSLCFRATACELLFKFENHWSVTTLPGLTQSAFRNVQRVQIHIQENTKLCLDGHSSVRITHISMNVQ